MSELADICTARRTETRGGRFVDFYKIGFGCWLPDGHDGPHWALLEEQNSREPRAWTGDDSEPAKYELAGRTSPDLETTDEQ